MLTKQTKADKKEIRKAFDLAVEAHKTQRRKSGEPYIYHPIAVAHIAAKEIRPRNYIYYMCSTA